MSNKNKRREQHRISSVWKPAKFQEWAEWILSDLFLPSFFDLPTEGDRSRSVSLIGAKCSSRSQLMPSARWFVWQTPLSCKLWPCDCMSDWGGAGSIFRYLKSFTARYILGESMHSVLWLVFKCYLPVQPQGTTATASFKQSDVNRLDQVEGRRGCGFVFDPITVNITSGCFYCRSFVCMFLWGCGFKRSSKWNTTIHNPHWQLNTSDYKSTIWK